MTSGRVWQEIVPCLLLILVLGCVSTPQAFAEDKCALDAVSITEISPALTVPACRNSEFLDGIPDLSGQQIRSFDVSFRPSTEIFRGERRAVIEIRQIVVESAEWVRPEFANVVANKVPIDSCDSISAGGIGYAVEGGSVVADFDLHFQKRACTDSTCYKGVGSWHGFLYPIFGPCLAKTDVPGGGATLGVHTVITPQLVVMPNGDANIQIKIVPTASVKEGPSELVKNIVGALTLGIGSKAIQDEFEHQVGDFKGSLSPEVRSVALLKLPKARDEPIKVTFHPEQPYFLQSGSELMLAISRVATTQRSIACGFRNKAIEAKKFFQSCINPQREYVVQNNDSLWHIAQQIYGEGQYYHVLEHHNETNTRTAAFLKPGQTLAIVPFFEIQGQNEVVVSSGDTLWKIAGKKLGDPRLYHKLLSGNRQQISDPRHLVTLVPIKVN